MRPFEGIRVIDITHVLAGPFAAYQLAVLGADVIKVEHPDEPDQSRGAGTDKELNRRNMGTAFLTQASNKRSITLDLKQEKPAQRRDFRGTRRAARSGLIGAPLHDDDRLRGLRGVRRPVAQHDHVERAAIVLDHVIVAVEHALQDVVQRSLKRAADDAIGGRPAHAQIMLLLERGEHLRDGRLARFHPEIARAACYAHLGMRGGKRRLSSSGSTRSRRTCRIGPYFF